MDAKLRRTLLKREDRCELCGSHIGLEVHHIIPRVCGGEDREENCIVICSHCHGKLTPKALLTKAGIQKEKEYSETVNLVSDLWNGVYENCLLWIDKNKGATPLEALEKVNGAVNMLIEMAREDEKQIGQKAGAKLTTKKSIEEKEIIVNRSKDFNGNMPDKELIKLTGLARGTFYKYKRELKAEV